MGAASFLRCPAPGNIAEHWLSTTRASLDQQQGQHDRRATPAAPRDANPDHRPDHRRGPAATWAAGRVSDVGAVLRS